MGLEDGSLVGLLGVKASSAADFNLVAHIVLGLLLLAGAVLARMKLFRAHMICQSAVLLLNLPLIALIMWPSFRDSIAPGLADHLGKSFYWVTGVHAAIGAVAELLGLWIILVAATSLIPPRYRFQRYKLWMRTELVLWWIVVGWGIAVYFVWY